MKRNAWMVVPLLAACVRSAGAEPAAALDDKQLLGMRLFNQSCRVCHTKPQMTSPVYGPDLSQNDLSGAGWPVTRQPFLLETSRPGVFAVGDVRGGNIKRVASAVGEGSIAVAFVHQVLQQQ